MYVILPREVTSCCKFDFQGAMTHGTRIWAIDVGNSWSHGGKNVNDVCEGISDYMCINGGVCKVSTWGKREMQEECVVPWCFQPM